MHNMLLNKARALKPQTRAAVEAELGRSLADDEDVSIMAFSTHDAPRGKTRQAAARKLKAYFKRIDRKASPAGAGPVLREALQNARRGYRERE